MNRILSLMLVLVLASTVSAGPIDVYLLAGQSNAGSDGITSVAGIPAHLSYLASPQTDILYRPTTGTVTDLKPITKNGVDYFGPELSMMRTLADANPGRDFIVIKYAIGSTSLDVDWDPNTGTKYANMMTRFSSTMGWLTTNGYTPTVKGFAWMQGEEDSLHEQQALNYADNLDEFIIALREDIDENLPIVMGRINAPIRPYRIEVREAQEYNGWLGVRVINIDDLALQDPVHLNAESQIAFGIRLASGFKEAMQELPPTGPWMRGVPEPSSAVLGVLLIAGLALTRRYNH